MKTIVNLIIAMMIGIIVGTFVKTAENHKSDVFCKFVQLVSAIVAEVPNNTIEFNQSPLYTVNTKTSLQMNTNAAVDEFNHTATTSSRVSHKKRLKNHLSDPGILDTG